MMPPDYAALNEQETLDATYRPDGRCEDYPCCGHTDGLGCNYDTSYYSSHRYYLYASKHAYCDHEAGFCEAAIYEEE